MPYWGSFVANVPLGYTDPSGHACKVIDGDEVCGDDIPPWLGYDRSEMLIQWLRWQGYDLKATAINIWLTGSNYNSYPLFSEDAPPIATWTWDDGQGAFGLPNPHVQLREDWEAFNDLLLLGADATADGLTILGHGLMLLGGASLLAPPQGDEIAAIGEETGAFFILSIATGIDVLAWADTAATRGPLSKEFGVQTIFLAADIPSARTGGTYVAQTVFAASDVGVDIFGDSAGLSQKYGPGVTLN